jgi:ribosome biogenesis GTPase / thiamine phosphate phosphatase
LTGPSLDSLGYTPELAAALARIEGEGLEPGRVVTGHQQLHRVAAADGEFLAEVAGSLRHAARGAEDLPAVGDWVALRLRAGERRALIQAVLPRRTAFVRRAAGDRTVAQVLAANVDTVFLVMGLDADFNPRRLERALVLAWQSGAQPVVLLNKADLCDDVAARRSEAERVAVDVPVRVIAAKPGQDLDALTPWLEPGRTVVLLGSSGVGKSTIVNRLLGRDKQRTAAVRAGDQRGRHTTSQRELIPLPGGALLIDTPGLREVQLWAEGTSIDAAFEDVKALAAGCRFADCSHVLEPSCAVRSAVAEGRLDPARLASFLRLQGELRALEIREDPLLRREERSRWKAIHKSLRKGPKGDS